MTWGALAAVGRTNLARTLLKLCSKRSPRHRTRKGEDGRAHWGESSLGSSWTLRVPGPSSPFPAGDHRRPRVCLQMEGEAGLCLSASRSFQRTRAPVTGGSVTKWNPNVKGSCSKIEHIDALQKYLIQGMYFCLGVSLDGTRAKAT